MKSYGIDTQNKNFSEVDKHLENLKIKGYSVRENSFSEKDCELACEKMEQIYLEQETFFHKKNLELINEQDMARMPFLSNNYFLKFIFDPIFLEITEKVLGKYFHIHLQNGIINRPQKIHHQTSWHRDLPYQNWTSTKPLAINAFYCLTDFTIENGATVFLPYSHKFDEFPSDKFIEDNKVQIEAPKGSVIYFDSMIFHRAGVNKSNNTRYGLNNMMVLPILKKQIDFGRDQVDNIDIDSILFDQVMGFNNIVPTSVDEYRKLRLLKISK